MEAQNELHNGDDFPPLDVDELENEDDISIAKIKSQLGFADDEEGTFIGLPGDSVFKGDSSELIYCGNLCLVF